MSTNDVDDEDVVFEGSPLHEHLKKFGLSEESEARKVESPKPLLKRRTENAKKKSSNQKDSALLQISGQTIAWPRDCSEILELEIAKKIVESELLVQEDQDFISNFILTEEAFAVYEKKLEEKKCAQNSSSSIFGDVLLFSGSIAAVAGTILFLSERTRLATTVAAVLPTALAAFSTARNMDSKANSDADCSDESKEQFLKLVDLLLSDMKLFKQMVRKSLNLLQGMELMNAGYLFAVNKSTGAASTSNDTKLVTQHQRNAAFPALRLATYKCTIQLLQSYREALSQLLEASPLADYVDMKDHYIAFVDLECFGIEDVSAVQDGESVTIRALKDAVQLALVQQSEYLRRFSLVFCEKVREDNDLNKTDVMKQIREMATTLKTINKKLSRVFEYHEAMGLNPEQKSVSLKKKQLQFNFVPLRSLYTSLFSSGLHLQNSLLKIREMEKLFDLLEKQKKENRDHINSLIPSEVQLVEWLKGFQDVQTELNAVVGCLEEGVSQINVLKGEDDEAKKKSHHTIDSPDVDINETGNDEKHQQHKVIVINDTVEADNENFDEVFEAFVTEERCGNGLNGFEDECARHGSDSLSGHDSSKVLMKELKQVLVGKAEEHRAREERALERKHMKGQAGENSKAGETSHELLSPVDNQLSIASTLNGGIEDKNAVTVAQSSLESRNSSTVSDAKVVTEASQRVTDGFAETSATDSNEKPFDNVNGTQTILNDVESKKLSASNDVSFFASPNQMITASTSNGDRNSVNGALKENGDHDNLSIESDNQPPLYSSDPFCPLGSMSKHGKNCFDDDFISAKPSLKHATAELEDVPSTDSSASDSELDEGSTSSSHPSTIRSAGCRKTEPVTLSGYTDSSDEDQLSCEDRLEPEFPKQKNFKKRKNHHRHDFEHSLPQLIRDKSSGDEAESRISISEIRSLSTPDLKQLVVAHSSPYVSLEHISPKKEPSQLVVVESDSSSNSESSDWGSMDELENFTLKTFRRPLRPAAQRKATFKSKKSENSSTETERSHKNGERIVKSGQKVPENGHVEPQNGVGDDKPMVTKMKAEQTVESSSHASVYRQRHREQINEIRQPSGFDTLLASQVVARAQNFGKRFNFLQKEEVFGSE